MSDNNRNCIRPTGTYCGSGSVLIDTYQVFDSCRDRDCFEDTRVYLDDLGQSLIEHTGQVRTKTAEICSSAISVEPVQLSRGFYRIIVRYYVKLCCEACVTPGKSQTFEGIAVTEKNVVLYGGEGEVRIFRSNTVSDSFCAEPCQGEMSTNLPVAVVETVDPVILGTRVVEPSVCHCCCCSSEDIPSSISGQFDRLTDEGQKYLAVSLGFFSVIRLERPEQYIVNAVEFSVPDKECSNAEDSSPCDAFNRMAFPIEEFSPGRAAPSGTFCGCTGNSVGNGGNGGSIGTGSSGSCSSVGTGNGSGTNSSAGNNNTDTGMTGNAGTGCNCRR